MATFLHLRNHTLRSKRVDRQIGAVSKRTAAKKQFINGRAVQHFTAYPFFFFFFYQRAPSCRQYENRNDLRVDAISAVKCDSSVNFVYPTLPSELKAVYDSSLLAGSRRCFGGSPAHPRTSRALQFKQLLN